MIHGMARSMLELPASSWRRWQLFQRGGDAERDGSLLKHEWELKSWKAGRIEDDGEEDRIEYLTQGPRGQTRWGGEEIRGRDTRLYQCRSPPQTRWGGEEIRDPDTRLYQTRTPSITMGKPLSRPGCFRQGPCCSDKRGEGGVVDGYGDGYVPQRSIYDTMCINEQIDHGGSAHSTMGSHAEREAQDYSTNGSLRGGARAEMFEHQRSITPNPSFVRRLDERVIFDSLKLVQEGQGVCHSPGGFIRSVSPSVSSISAPVGPSSSSGSKKHHHHHHHHHQDSGKCKDNRHSWKVMTPPSHTECMELTSGDMLERGYLNPTSHSHSLYPHGSSMTSPLISPYSGSPHSSGYHTPVFFSPARSRPAQSQSLRLSPPPIQPRLPSQSQSLRLSPPTIPQRSPYRAPLIQLSARDLQEDLRDRGWGRAERERDAQACFRN
ncbi:uncharacterized protein FYW47_003383 [Aplochiton taeniatus]